MLKKLKSVFHTHEYDKTRVFDIPEQNVIVLYNKYRCIKCGNVKYEKISTKTHYLPSLTENCVKDYISLGYLFETVL